MSKKSSGAPELSRSMTAGQMEMISLGGAIGVGLFMGSTSTIKWTGPSVILAYALVGIVLYVVMRALGEMIYINPGTGSFADYASEYVHPIFGYLAKWANVFEYIVVGMSEVVAATEYLQYWWPHLPAWISGIVINLFLSLWSPVNKIDNLNRYFYPMQRPIFEFELGTHPRAALAIWIHNGCEF